MSKSRSKRRSIFLSAISGNVLEYYDFTVYAVFSLAIGKSFFPGDSEIIQILASLAVFASGFTTRPIGGIIFGHIADKYGRRISLITSMLGMTIPTFIIGMIPEYDIIGYYAPAILVLMRLIQGLCISGEGAGAAIFILEHYQLRPGFTAGIVHASNIAGTLFATLIGILLERILPGTDFAWRFAFVLGGIMGIVGFYFRLRVLETPIFTILAEKKRTLKSPFIHVIQTASRSMFITFCLGGAASSIVYLIKTYINIYHVNVLKFDKTTALYYLSYSSVIMMIAMATAGHISDVIGRFRTISCTAAAVFFLTLPALYMISSPDPLVQLVVLTILASLGGSIAGAAYIFIISLFTPEQRFTGVAFSYNLGIALFGGTSAMISRGLLEATGLYYAPAFYLMATSGVFLLVIYMMRRTIRELLAHNLKK